MNLLGTDDNLDVITFDGGTYNNDSISTEAPPVPYLDTYVGDSYTNFSGTSGNTNFDSGSPVWGDFYQASANGGGTTMPQNAEPSLLDRLGNTFNDIAKNLQTGKVKSGSAQMDKALAPLFGLTNPAPSNSNTNMANKALNAWTTMLHQLNFGSDSSVPGVGVSQQKSNYIVGLILGAIALFVVFSLIIRGR